MTDDIIKPDMEYGLSAAEISAGKALNKMQGELDAMKELLGNIREWLSDQMDVEDGPPGYEHEQRPNAALSFAAQIDALTKRPT